MLLFFVHFVPYIVCTKCTLRIIFFTKITKGKGTKYVSQRNYEKGIGIQYVCRFGYACSVRPS